jgi:hypothetical protein
VIAIHVLAAMAHIFILSRSHREAVAARIRSDLGLSDCNASFMIRNGPFDPAMIEPDRAPSRCLRIPFGAATAMVACIGRWSRAPRATIEPTRSIHRVLQASLSGSVSIRRGGRGWSAVATTADSGLRRPALLQAHEAARLYGGIAA